MRSPARSGRLATLLFTLVALSDCGGGGAIGNPTVGIAGLVASVTLSADNQHPRVGQSVTAIARAYDAGGNQLSGRTTAFSSSAPSVLSVAGNGVGSALTPGSATLSAAVEGKTGSLAFSVTALPVATVSVTAPLAMLTQGTSEQLSVVVRDANGGVLTDRAVAWSSSSSPIATVSASGYVVAVAPGATTITAVSEGQGGSITIAVHVPLVRSVSVTPSSASLTVGQSAQLQAVAHDSAGIVLSGRSIAWQTSAAGVATVSASGLVAATGVGTATVSASVDGVVGTAAIVGNSAAAVLQRVVVSPHSVSLAAGATQQFTALGSYSDGSSRAVAVSYTATGGTITSGGLCTAGSTLGTYRVIATQSGGTLADTGAVTIVAAPPPPPTLATITVSPATASVNVGQTVQLTATGRDAAGNPVTGLILVWTSSSTGLATVSSYGVVTGIGGGSVSVTAAASGKSGSAAITVVAPTLQRIVLSPKPVSLTAGATQQFTALGSYSDGSSRAVAVTYAATGGTITAGGLYTAGSVAGTYRVIATQSGGTLADTSVVTIVAAPPPPPPGSVCKNEPAGYSLFQDRSFTEVPPGGPAYDSYNWQSNGGPGDFYVANLALTTDATVKTLTPDGTSTVLQMTFPQGFGGGSAPVWFGMRDGGPRLPTNTGALYMCVMVKIDPAWTNGGNVGTKFFFLRTPYQGGPGGENHYWGFSALENDATVMLPVIGTQFGSNGAGLESTRLSVAGTNATGGGWRQFEILVVAESPAGATTGIGKIWLDGKPVLDNRDMQFFLPGQAPGWSSIDVEPTYGGGTNPVPRTMHWWLGRVRVTVK
jgi:uncharacterized protein YjdB